MVWGPREPSPEEIEHAHWVAFEHDEYERWNDGYDHEQQCTKQE